MFGDAFVLLFIAHLLADYPGQTDHQAAHKAAPGLRGWLANACHAGTHVALSALALAVGWWALGTSPAPAAVAVALVWVGASHALIDRRWLVVWWMEHTRQSAFRAHGGAAHVDQAAHLALGLAPAALVLAALG
jgi:hypothetical protein